MSRNMTHYGPKTGLPGNLTLHQCQVVVQLAANGTKKDLIKKRFGVSMKVVDDILAMHANGVLKFDA